MPISTFVTNARVQKVEFTAKDHFENFAAKNLLGVFMIGVKSIKMILRQFFIIVEPPNGRALSCGADNFQYTQNETSSCDKQN